MKTPLALRVGGHSIRLRGPGIPRPDALKAARDGFLAEGEPEWDVRVEEGTEASIPGDVCMPSIRTRWRGGRLEGLHDLFECVLRWRERRGDAVFHHTSDGSREVATGLFLRLWLALDAAAKGGVAVHGAALAEEDAGYLFCAPGGGGKTTISLLWDRGLILSDDISLVASEAGVLVTHPTPFRRELPRLAPASHAAVPLRGIYFLHQRPDNSVMRLSPQDSVVQLLRRVFFYPDGGELGSLLLETCSRIVERVPCYDLGFRPDPSVWQVVFGETGGAG